MPSPISNRTAPPSSQTTPVNTSRYGSEASICKTSSSCSHSPLTPKQTGSLLKMLKSSKRRSPGRKTIVKKSSMDVIGKDWLVTGSTPKKGKKIKATYDRFIPNRDAMNIQSTQYNFIRRENYSKEVIDSATLAYQEEVAKACGIALDKRILAFKAEPPSNDKEDLRATYNRPLKTAATTQIKRRIMTVPEKVLDAVGMVDDFYLHLLDWGVNNILAVGLDKTVYLWNGDTGDVQSLAYSGPHDSISSLSFAGDGSYLAIGTLEGDTQIWDIESGTKLRSMSGHVSRVGVLSWDKHILSSGCRDGSIWHHDVRIPNHKVAELLNHTSEVCGLSWRSDGVQLASGGNDNLVNIWDARSSIPKFTKTNHTAAVKAIAWCPWNLNLLATGGGSYDRHIHFWNTSAATRLQSVDTGSQVISLIWSKEYKELLSSHGFPDNHLALWSYPNMNKIIDIPAHETRVLHTAMAPGGEIVASAASDENLKFWRLFESSGKKITSRESKKEREGGLKNAGMTIR